MKDRALVGIVVASVLIGAVAGLAAAPTSTLVAQDDARCS